MTILVYNVIKAQKNFCGLVIQRESKIDEYEIYISSIPIPFKYLYVPS